MLVDDKLAKEKLARVLQNNLGANITIAGIIKHTDLTDCAPDQGSVLNALAKAIDGVLCYDWSDNDDDAVAAMERLRVAAIRALPDQKD